MQCHYTYYVGIGLELASLRRDVYGYSWNHFLRKDIGLPVLMPSKLHCIASLLASIFARH